MSTHSSQELELQVSILEYRQTSSPQEINFSQWSQLENRSATKQFSLSFLKKQIYIYRFPLIFNRLEKKKKKKNQFIHMKVRKHKRDESLHFYIVKRKKPSTHLMILHSKPPFSYSPPSTPSINPLFHLDLIEGVLKYSRNQQNCQDKFCKYLNLEMVVNSTFFNRLNISGTNNQNLFSTVTNQK